MPQQPSLSAYRSSLAIPTAQFGGYYKCQAILPVLSHLAYALKIFCRHCKCQASALRACSISGSLYIYKRGKIFDGLVDCDLLSCSLYIAVIFMQENNQWKVEVSTSVKIDTIQARICVEAWHIIQSDKFLCISIKHLPQFINYTNYPNQRIWCL